MGRYASRGPRLLLIIGLVCADCRSLSVSRPPLAFPNAARRSRAAVALDGGLLVADGGTGVLTLVDSWFQSSPYESAFCVTALKASTADFVAQAREQKKAAAALAAAGGEEDAPDQKSKVTLLTCDDVSCEEVEVEVAVGSKDPGVDIEWRRNLGFVLYGGLYQGVVQYFIFNECFPVWFGEGVDVATVATKVIVDQLVLTPFLCLPVAYLFKGLVFGKAPADEMRRYIADARQGLLLKYWLIWTPAQCLTFGVVPAQWRIPFIAIVSFFWLILLSTISSRDDAAAVVMESPAPPPAPAPGRDA